jgi:peroxiredoxin
MRRGARAGVRAVALTLWTCAVGCAGTVVIGCAGTEKNTPSPILVTPSSAAIAPGTAARDFVAPDIDGHDIRLSRHLGRDVVLLDFCSTWCEPCVAEFPHLRAMYEANKAKGFVVLAISVDGPETVANVPGFARRNQLNFPVLLDRDSQIAALYNPKKVAPVTVLINRSGTIVNIREGYSAGDEVAIASEVAVALDGPTLEYGRTH